MNELLINYVLETLKSGDDVSIPLIQRKFKTGYNDARNIFNNLKDEGRIISNENNPNGISKMK